MVDAGKDDATPPGAFNEPTPAKETPVAGEAAPSNFKSLPSFDAKPPVADTRELPPKDTALGVAEGHNPSPRFAENGRRDAYIEPRPLASLPAGEGRGVPGTKKLEGVQSPSLTIEKIAPTEIQVGKPATFEVVVTNTSQVTAYAVQLLDEVPRGTRLVSTTPRAEQSADGNVVWALGDLGAGPAGECQDAAHADERRRDRLGRNRAVRIASIGTYDRHQARA